jgi:hypothetical protein
VTINEELEAVVDAYEALVEEAAAAPERQLSAEQRRTELQNALDKVDVVRLAELTKKLSGLIEAMLANPIDAEAEEPCTEAQLAALMTEQLDFQELADLLKLRYEARRARVFAHITAANIADAVPDPSYAPGEVEVPSLGRRFTREGGNPKLKLDEAKLRELLGGHHVEKVFKREVEIKHVLNEKALMKLVAKEPELMEVVRECIISVGHTSQSFHIRNLTKE